MLFYFYSSYDAFFPLTVFIAFPLIVAILTSPILVFYWVFRNPINREKDYKIYKEYSKWLSLICAAASLIMIVVGNSKLLFGSGIFSNRLSFISMIIAALAFITGIVSLPRWQGFAAMTLYCFLWFYFFFIIPHYQFID
jgi:K+-sensing histidine kinase KdpD